MLKNSQFSHHFSCSNIWTILCRHQENVKITGPKYHYNKFDKKVDISDEKKTKIPWWINNNDNACHQIVTPSLDIQAYNHQEVCGINQKLTTLCSGVKAHWTWCLNMLF